MPGAICNCSAIWACERSGNAARCRTARTLSSASQFALRWGGGALGRPRGRWQGAGTMGAVGSMGSSTKGAGNAGSRASVRATSASADDSR